MSPAISICPLLQGPECRLCGRNVRRDTWPSRQKKPAKCRVLSGCQQWRRHALLTAHMRWTCSSLWKYCGCLRGKKYFIISFVLFCNEHFIDQTWRQLESGTLAHVLLVCVENLPELEPRHKSPDDKVLVLRHGQLQQGVGVRRIRSLLGPVTILQLLDNLNFNSNHPYFKILN